MNGKRIFSAAMVLTLAAAGSCLAETYSGRAVAESGRAASHAGNSVANGLAASGQATSAAAAVPLAVAGSIGIVCNEMANGLMEAATAPAGSPLPLTDETVTAGAPPDEALKTDNRRVERKVR